MNKPFITSENLQIGKLYCLGNGSFTDLNGTRVRYISGGAWLVDEDGIGKAFAEKTVVLLIKRLSETECKILVEDKIYIVKLDKLEEL